MTKETDILHKINMWQVKLINQLLEMQDFSEVLFSKTIIPEKKYKTKDTKIQFALRCPKKKYSNKKYEIHMGKEYCSLIKVITKQAYENNGYIYESELFEECKSNKEYSLSKLNQEALKKMLYFLRDLEIMLDFRDSTIKCVYDKTNFTILFFTSILFAGGYCEITKTT